MTTRRSTCPTCGRPAEYSPTNPWRPFCCARCRSIDLGAWASEAYAVPASDEDAGEPDPEADPR